jgi:ribosome production factor 1
MPLTIEDKREIDENFILQDAYEDEELQKEEEIDEFNAFFTSEKPPKIMMTTSIRP